MLGRSGVQIYTPLHFKNYAPFLMPWWWLQYGSRNCWQIFSCYQSVYHDCFRSVVAKLTVYIAIFHFFLSCGLNNLTTISKMRVLIKKALWWSKVKHPSTYLSVYSQVFCCCSTLHTQNVISSGFPQGCVFLIDLWQFSTWKLFVHLKFFHWVYIQTQVLVTFIWMWLIYT